MAEPKARLRGSLLDNPRGGGGVEVRNWASILDDQTRDQALRTAKSPVLAGPVALMPDAHLGKGATVGSVIITRNAIIPAAVGVDIGCGMIAALLFTGSTEELFSKMAFPPPLHSPPSLITLHRQALRVARP